MADIVLDKLTKVFPDGTAAVSALDLVIDDAEFVVFVGPSGCGKTTALRMIAGLEEPTAGEIRIGGDVVNDVPPKRRDIAMVFQDYALYPQMSVFDNMAFALKLRRVPRATIRQRVQEAAVILHLEDLLRRRPRALSGGQRQRVAMGRAIVREPQAFLLDEPLSNLDAKLRVQMRAEISRIQRNLAVTTIYVTHDQTEAMTMGDRVAVMKKGVLQQVAPPEELYGHPINLFTAGFIGAPAMNMVEAELARTGDGLELRFGANALRCHDAVLRARPGLAAYEGRSLVVGIRPEHLEDAAHAASVPPDQRLGAVVDVREALGSEVLLFFAVESRGVPAALGELWAEDGAAAEANGFSGGASFVARVHANSKAREGDRVDLAVEMESLHYFDPETGLAIYGEPT